MRALLYPAHLPARQIDPAVSVVCDVQNTLVDNIVRLFAPEALQEKYLPRLATDMVRARACAVAQQRCEAADARHAGGILLPVRGGLRQRRLCAGFSR